MLPVQVLTKKLQMSDDQYVILTASVSIQRGRESQQVSCLEAQRH
jgi:hypothetical protein